MGDNQIIFRIDLETYIRMQTAKVESIYDGEEPVRFINCKSRAMHRDISRNTMYHHLSDYLDANFCGCFISNNYSARIGKFGYSGRPREIETEGGVGIMSKPEMVFGMRLNSRDMW